MEVIIINTTIAVAEYLKLRGISIKAIARKTKLPEASLYSSLGRQRSRDLRADEFLAICQCIGEDPMKFAPKTVSESN